MRNWLAILLIIPLFLLTISGTTSSPASGHDAQEDEETVFVTVEQQTKEDIETNTEEADDIHDEYYVESSTPNNEDESYERPTVQDTTHPSVVATEPPATEPPVMEEAEPQIKETEPIVEETEPQTTVLPEHQSGLISLGIFKLTAYCSCRKCCGKYALNRPVDENGKEIVYGSIGVRLEAGVSIAVDPKVIPYGTKVVINGHTYTAHDTGGGIKGKRIDIYFDSHTEAWDFGTRKAEVFIYG